MGKKANRGKQSKNSKKTQPQKDQAKSQEDQSKKKQNHLQQSQGQRSQRQNTNQAKTEENQSKKEQNHPQQSQPPKSQKQLSKNPNQAPQPKFQARQDYASLEQKFQINHCPQKKGKKRNKNSRNRIDQNEFCFERIQEPVPNRGLFNLGNSCFANALFQCLYHVIAFRDSVITSSEGTSSPLLRSLAHFFKEMADGFPRVQKAYIELLNALFAKRPEFQRNVMGDSSILLRALFEELENESKLAPYLQIFIGGELTKRITCPGCPMNKQIKESMKILEVQDINFTLENAVNFFQSSKLLRKCSCSQEKQPSQCKYRANDLPEVLIIRIHDVIGSQETTKILPKFTLKQEASSETSTYEFVAAVMNRQKGEKGVHSVELSLHNNNYYIFDDHSMYCTNLNSVDLHPKVLFYKKRIPEKPLVDEPLGL